MNRKNSDNLVSTFLLRTDGRIQHICLRVKTSCGECFSFSDFEHNRHLFLKLSIIFAQKFCIFRYSDNQLYKNSNLRSQTKIQTLSRQPSSLNNPSGSLETDLFLIHLQIISENCSVPKKLKALIWEDYPKRLYNFSIHVE